MTAATRQSLEIALFWACILLAGLLIWAYALVGFWYVNQTWLRAFWRLIEG